MSNKNHPKKIQNKGRDMLADYWKTNREVYKDNAEREKERQEKEGKGWTPIEKFMLAIAIAAAILFIVKYFILGADFNAHWFFDLFDFMSPEEYQSTVE